MNIVLFIALKTFHVLLQHISRPILFHFYLVVEGEKSGIYTYRFLRWIFATSADQARKVPLASRAAIL